MVLWAGPVCQKKLSFSKVFQCLGKKIYIVSLEMDESVEEMDVENCGSCNEPMNVSALAPYTNVQCPNCGVESHVKCQLGRYHILRRQGLGGMSVVFAAEDSTLGRKVAIKLLNEDFSKDEKRIQEFEKEAKITAAISHPNVVRVYTVGQEFGRYYIAMELVEGDSLEQLMNQQDVLDEQMLTRIAIETVEGLKAAHEAGLIHRDMKPGNILIDGQGRAKIVDFGLALMTSGGKAIAEEIWATPYYVPPETLELKEEDLRSDIYALGSSLYHALSGNAPFTTETRSTSELIKLKTQIPSLSKVSEEVSPFLCEVIEKMMAHNADERFQQYDELLTALKQVELHYRTGHEPEELSEQTQARRSNRKLGNGVKISVALGLVALGVTSWLMVQPDEESAAVEVEVQPAEPLVLEEDSTEDTEAERALMVAQLRNAQNLFDDGRFMDAHRAYLELATNDVVVSETIYWTGLRSAISAWLAGESQNARVALRETLKRQRKEDDQLSEIDVKLQKAMGRLLKLEKVGPKLVSKISSDLDIMIIFSAALKEWDQGRWEDAEQLFISLKRAHSDSDHESLVYYQQLANKYLTDLEALDVFRDGLNPKTIEDAKELQSAVIKARGELLTKGRAGYNTQQWQRQLSAKIVEIDGESKRRDRAVKKRELEKLRAWNEVRAWVLADLGDFKFERVYQRLSKSAALTAQDEKWKTNTLFITKPVADLYEVTFKALEGKSADFVIRRRDGMVEYEKVLGAEESGLLVEDKKGKEVLLTWPELSPYTMLELHEKRSISHLSDQEKLDQRKQLICYSWLMGLEGKAQQWAKKLAVDDPEFSKGWNSYLESVDE